MTPQILLLVLASATIHACWNLWTKQIRDAARGGPIAWLLTTLSVAFYLPIAIVAFAVGHWRPTAGALLWIAGSSVIHVAYFLTLLRGYRVGDLSVVYPTARGTGPLWAAVGGILLFGERPTVLSVAGALLVATGVLMLTARASGSGSPGRRAGLEYGLLTGLLIGAYTLVDGWAVKRMGIPPLIYYCAGEALRVPLYSPLALRDRQGVANAWASQRGRLVAIAALSPLSYLLMLLALRSGDVSRVAPAREISILIGTWLGGRVLGETDRRRRIVAAIAFMAGVVALAFA